MKFKLLEDDFEEQFTSPRSREDHYRKRTKKDHQYTELTPEQYEALADNLAMTPVNYKNILGYQTTAPEGDNRVRYAKYNVDTEDFVIYGLDSHNKPLIISLYKRSIREYNTDKAIKYLDEIPVGK